MAYDLRESVGYVVVDPTFVTDAAFFWLLRPGSRRRAGLFRLSFGKYSAYAESSDNSRWTWDRFVGVRRVSAQRRRRARGLGHVYSVSDKRFTFWQNIRA